MSIETNQDGLSSGKPLMSFEELMAMFREMGVGLPGFNHP
jgi:hypothetical protein